VHQHPDPGILSAVPGLVPRFPINRQVKCSPVGTVRERHLENVWRPLRLCNHIRGLLCLDPIQGLLGNRELDGLSEIASRLDESQQTVLQIRHRLGSGSRGGGGICLCGGGGSGRWGGRLCGRSSQFRLVLEPAILDQTPQARCGRRRAV
jgi:hypothetical protein